MVSIVLLKTDVLFSVNSAITGGGGLHYANSSYLNMVDIVKKVLLIIK